MSEIKSRIDRSSSDYVANEAVNRKLAADLAELVARIRAGGSEQARAQHHERGKMLARERIERLVDPGSPFLEFGTLAAHELYDDWIPSAGIVTGIGRVHGIECVIVANDATVKGGTYYPLTVKKHLRAQEIALENELPCVYLVDSGGAFLPRQIEVFPDREHFGRIFYNQAQMSSRAIPQLAVVMGSCTAGGAYVPAMCDESIIVREQGTIFLGGPPLVQAATGEKVDAESLGGGDVHARQSGVVDYLAENDVHALWMARRMVGHLNRSGAPPPEFEPVAPRHAAEDLYGVIPRDTRHPYDVREVIARIVDGSELDEFKALYGTTLVCGFARIGGYAVGIIANNGVLFSESALKGAHFRALQPAQRAAAAAEHHGFHGWPHYEAAASRDGAKMHGGRLCDRTEVTVIIGGPFGRQLCDVRARLRGALPVDMAERADLGHGRRAGRHGAGHRQARRHAATWRSVAGSRGTGVSRRDPATVRNAGAPDVRERAVVGRRCDRPRRHAHGTHACARRRAHEAGCRRASVRHLPDVAACSTAS